MRAKFVFAAILLALLGPALAQRRSEEPRLKILIRTYPEGAIVRQNDREIGKTGTEFSLAVSKIPRSGELNLQLYRAGFKPYGLRIPAQDVNSALADLEGVFQYPDSPLPLESDGLRGWLELHSQILGLTLLSAVALALMGRRHLQVKAVSAERESRVARLKDQIATKHEFAMATIGRYRVLDQLGEGGIAKVYRAVPDDTLDESQAVAIKILHPHLCANGDHRQRFVREGNVSKDLIHPNIVRLSEIDIEGEVVYLVLELLEGETLRDKLKKGTLSLDYMRTLGSQVLSALVYAHELNVVHRDLTPANVMVLRNDQVKLMDFGLARRREVGHTITVTGVVQGTPGYMAPEQLKEELDARSDQYSLGVIFFEMLTGRRPIERSDPMQLIMATYTEDAPDPRELNPQIPSALAEFILKLLRRQPEQRFACMKDAAVAFDACFEV